MTIRLICRLLLVAPLLVLVDCAFDEAANPATGDHDRPPFVTESILPMAKGNRWEYSSSEYDGNGVRTRSQQRSARSIPEVLGYEPDSGLFALSFEQDTSEPFELVYRYQWETGTNQGILLTYRPPQRADTPGLYIIGEYRGTRDSLYASPALFRAYPAAAGLSWVDRQRDTVTLSDTCAHFYFPNERAANFSRIKALRCLLYVKAEHDTISRYYYHPSIGMVGYVLTIDGVIRQTSILRSFTGS